MRRSKSVLKQSTVDRAIVALCSHAEQKRALESRVAELEHLESEVDALTSDVERLLVYRKVVLAILMVAALFAVAALEWGDPASRAPHKGAR